MSGCKYKTGSVLCHKITANHSNFCPFHCLIVEDDALAYKRRAERRKANKEFRKQQEEFLAQSPLAAVNPLFEEKKKDLGYSK